MTGDPAFNLWSEPWITAERDGGGLVTVSIAELLGRARELRALSDPSPLVVVGIHRLLVAILQDIFRPTTEADLIALWQADGFPPEALAAFERDYAQRFDLFSEAAPFLQSADIPRQPEKKGRGKSVGYLLAEQTAGTGVTHYHHLYEDAQWLCAFCCARGLLTIPPFASSGGAGIRPSINGVPPIYVIPGGETLYHSLVASLVTPPYQPVIADRDGDTPWWRHDPVVGKSTELTRVGYLHSLTFPARRVRLHPEPMARPCSRCGRTTTWGATEMVYEMGESRPKDAAFWQDPFAAYRVTDKGPLPIRPVAGRAFWREYTGLFLPQDDTKGGAIRPAVIGQLEELLERDALPYDAATRLPFLTVGLRTDRKMKIFEWETSGFRVPPALLSDVHSGLRVESALAFAREGNKILNKMYSRYFDGHSTTFPDAAPIKGTQAQRDRMLTRYWHRLGVEFQAWILRFGPDADADALLADWLETVVNIGEKAFREATKQLNSGNSAALVAEQAISHCCNTLRGARNKLNPQEEPA